MLADRLRVYTVVGSGGVGKTTVSASLAVALARSGRRTAVVTVDPARRLLEALGLGNAAAGEPVAVDGVGAAGSGGGLWAQALAVEGALANLVRELAPDGASAAALEHNRVYRQLVEAEAGAEEIAAVAQLYALADDKRYDAIVLDTPPAANALELFEAPAKLRAFLESRAIGLLLAAAGGERRERSSLRGRALEATTAMLLRVFARATGSELIGDLAGFLQVVAAARPQLIERAAAVERLLRDERTGYVVVCAPDPVGTREAEAVLEGLARLELPVAAVIVNRTHPPLLAAADLADLEERLGRHFERPLAARLAGNLRYLGALAETEAEAVRDLAGSLAGRPLISLPELDSAEDGLAGLGQLAGFLFK